MMMQWRMAAAKQRLGRQWVFSSWKTFMGLSSSSSDHSFVRSVGRAKIAHFTQSSFFKTAIAVRRRRRYEDGLGKKAAAPHRKRLQVWVFRPN